MPSDIISELTRKALQEGDVNALRELIKALVRSEQSGKVVQVVRDFLRSFPEQAAEVRQVINDLAKILGNKVIRKTQAMAKVVEKLGQLIPKPRPRPGGASGAWNFFRGAVKGLYNVVAGVILRGVQFFGPVGFAVVVAVVSGISRECD